MREQFTTNISRKNIERKEGQVERVKRHFSPEDEVDDIVIISLPAETFTPAFREWQKTKTSGGPPFAQSFGGFPTHCLTSEPGLRPAEAGLPRSRPSPEVLAEGNKQTIN